MRPWQRTLLKFLALAAAVYCVVAVDVVLRARSAYMEGEKYMRWYEHPGEKRAHFQDAFEARKAELEAKKAKGGMADEEFRERLELAEFERDWMTDESSVKYAYVWYQTAVELFTPPESPWVKKSRVRMREALALWKAELTRKGVPYEDYMFE